MPDSSSSRCLEVRSPSLTAASSRILMLTSWSEQSTPAELSSASVLILPPPAAYSIRARWVRPRLPPSPITRQRSSEASTRTASLALSPASVCVSPLAFTYVPIPSFQSRSTGARSDQVAVGVVTGRPRQLEQPAALLEARGRVGIRVDEHVPVVEGGDEPDVLREQHPVAEHVARHVADPDHRSEERRVGKECRSRWS